MLFRSAAPPPSPPLPEPRPAPSFLAAAPSHSSHSPPPRRRFLLRWRLCRPMPESKFQILSPPPARRRRPGGSGLPPRRTPSPSPLPCLPSPASADGPLASPRIQLPPLPPGRRQRRPADGAFSSPNPPLQPTRATADYPQGQRRQAGPDLPVLLRNLERAHILTWRAGDLWI